MTLIESIVELVKNTFEREGTGHDWYHIDRVRKVALQLAEKERAN
ncbi:MAG: hypothetical protein ACI9O2_000439, partial [Flammeovirgaceae bacterium]